MIMDIEQIYRTGYSAGLCGHKCYPLGNHIVNDAIEELEALREELAALKAVSLSGYIDNMEKIEYEANINGEAGMLMMASFAVKTANAYLKR